METARESCCLAVMHDTVDGEGDGRGGGGDRRRQGPRLPFEHGGFTLIEGALPASCSFDPHELGASCGPRVQELARELSGCGRTLLYPPIVRSAKMAAAVTDCALTTGIPVRTWVPGSYWSSVPTTVLVWSRNGRSGRRARRSGIPWRVRMRPCATAWRCACSACSRRTLESIASLMRRRGRPAARRPGRPAVRGSAAVAPVLRL